MDLAAPFYLHPAAAPAQWRALVDGTLDLAFAVINVHSGPGAEYDEHYYGPALAGGCRTPLVGYVDLSYGRRDVREVLTDVAAWRAWYGVTDVMLDCTPAEHADADTVGAIVAAVRAAGAQRVVINPGRVPDPEIAACADVVGTAETDWETYRSLPVALVTAQPGTASWHLVHGVPPQHAADARALAAERGAEFAWVTDGALPDPWSALPAWYFSA